MSGFGGGTTRTRGVDTSLPALFLQDKEGSDWQPLFVQEGSDSQSLFGGHLFPRIQPVVDRLRTGIDCSRNLRLAAPLLAAPISYGSQ
jgi:hypothetical protein